MYSHKCRIFFLLSFLPHYLTHMRFTYTYKRCVCNSSDIINMIQLIQRNIFLSQILTDIHISPKYLNLYSIYFCVRLKFLEIMLLIISWFPRLNVHVFGSKFAIFFWRLSHKNFFLNFAQESWERRLLENTRACLYEALPGFTKNISSYYIRRFWINKWNVEAV